MLKMTNVSNNECLQMTTKNLPNLVKSFMSNNSTIYKGRVTYQMSPIHEYAYNMNDTII